MKDKLGREITQGAYVVAPRGPRDLAVCRVSNIHPKMVTLTRVDKKFDTILARPVDVVVIDDVDVTAFKLK